MLLGMVSGVGLGMGVLDFGGDRRREGAVLGVSGPLLGFQVPIDYNCTRTTGGGKCFSPLSRMIRICAMYRL